MEEEDEVVSCSLDSSDSGDEYSGDREEDLDDDEQSAAKSSCSPDEERKSQNVDALVRCLITGLRFKLQ